MSTNDIKGLFQEFNTNESFHKYINMITESESESEVIADIYNDTELMNHFKSYITDELVLKHIIESKINSEIECYRQIMRPPRQARAQVQTTTCCSNLFFLKEPQW